ncbi:hypothetical protein DMUE_3432 [Dictyocoela muelleri]|nr:hypothetical protein DMUE_3432 [Dictyocoela muelleri]
MKIVKSQKGKDKIIHNDYIYNFDYKNLKYVTWRCVRRDCAGRLKTNLNMNEILKIENHWHEQEVTRITKMNLNDKLKKFACETNENFDISLNKSIAEIPNFDEKYI